MAKIDIRKIEKPGFMYYESVQDDHGVTYTGRLRRITPDGRTVLLQRYSFCRMLRSLVGKLQRGEAIDKTQLMQQFDVPGRVFNTALIGAKGIIEGTHKALEADLEDKEQAIERQIRSIFECEDYGEIEGRERKRLRLERQRKRILENLPRPKIHFGKKFYLDQEEKGWKKAYRQARADRLGCVGSKDELGGNSTFSIQSEFDPNDRKMCFSLWHAGKLMGKFGLENPKQTAELQAILAINRQPFKYHQVKSKIGKTKGKLVRQKITTGRIALTVWLIQEENHHWHIHISYNKPKTKPGYEPKGSLPVDLNCDSIAPMKVWIQDGQLRIEVLDKRYFDPDWKRGKKRNWLYHQINALVKMAKAEHLQVVLEYLDFEGSKRWMRTKLGAMLHIMPYRQIRKIFERKCMEQGVPLCYVKAAYTSVLGAALDEHPFLGRDQAAAVIIGLRGSQEGNAWLEDHCRRLENEEDPRLRISRKSKFGCTVQIDGRLTKRQSEEHPRLDSEADGYRFQTRVARGISDLSKAMGNWHFSHEGKCPLPDVWKRSESRSKDGIQWGAVTPIAPSAVPKTAGCSTLSS